RLRAVRQRPHLRGAPDLPRYDRPRRTDLHEPGRGPGLCAPAGDRVPGGHRGLQRPVAGQGLGPLPAPVPGRIAGAVGPLCGRPSAACSGADRGGTPASSLPAALAFGPASAPARAAGLPATQQRARGGAVVGPELRRGPALAASSGPSRGGPQGGTPPLLLAAPPGTGAAAAGPRDGVCAAAAGVQRVTSKWLHLSSSRVSSDFQVVALTRSGVGPALHH